MFRHCCFARSKPELENDACQSRLPLLKHRSVGNDTVHLVRHRSWNKRYEFSIATLSLHLEKYQ